MFCVPGMCSALKSYGWSLRTRCSTQAQGLDWKLYIVSSVVLYATSQGVFTYIWIGNSTVYPHWSWTNYIRLFGSISQNGIFLVRLKLCIHAVYNWQAPYMTYIVMSHNGCTGRSHSAQFLRRANRLNKSWIMEKIPICKEKSKLEQTACFAYFVRYTAYMGSQCIVLIFLYTNK